VAAKLVAVHNGLELRTINDSFSGIFFPGAVRRSPKKSDLICIQGMTEFDPDGQLARVARPGARMIRRPRSVPAVLDAPEKTLLKKD
jgi:hypothetical protein